MLFLVRYWDVFWNEQIKHDVLIWMIIPDHLYKIKYGFQITKSILDILSTWINRRSCHMLTTKALCQIISEENIA